MKKIILLIIPILLLTGCTEDYEYNKAKCGEEEYNIISIRRWSSSEYELKLTNGKKIEVHPMNCIFYNESKSEVEK